MEEIAGRVWRERLRVTVLADRDEPGLESVNELPRVQCLWEARRCRPLA